MLEFDYFAVLKSLHDVIDVQGQLLRLTNISYLMKMMDIPFK